MDDRDAGDSPYVDLLLPTGEEHRVWGVAIPDALSEAKAAEGDTIRLAQGGQETVTIAVTVRDPDTGERREEEREVRRNAWKVERLGPDEMRTQAEAAAAKKPRGKGPRLVRLRGTSKELTQIGADFAAVFGDEAEMSSRGTAHGVEGAVKHLRAMSDGGRAVLYTEAGKVVRGSDALTDLAETWKYPMRSRERRDVMHLILSSRAGTDPEAFKDAARAYLKEAFPTREYLFVMHNEGKHVHVHAAVVMTDRSGKRLDPNIANFRDWRALLAEKARERGINMQALERAEQARPRGFHDGDRRELDRLTQAELAGDRHAPQRRRQLVERIRSRDRGAILIPRTQRQVDKMVRAQAEWAEAGVRIAEHATMPEHARLESLLNVAEQFERLSIALASASDRNRRSQDPAGQVTTRSSRLAQTLQTLSEQLRTTTNVDRARETLEEAEAMLAKVSSTAQTREVAQRFLQGMLPFYEAMEQQVADVIEKAERRDQARARQEPRDPVVSQPSPAPVEARPLATYQQPWTWAKNPPDAVAYMRNLHAVYGSDWLKVALVVEHGQVNPRALDGLTTLELDPALRHLARRVRIERLGQEIAEIEKAGEGAGDPGKEEDAVASAKRSAELLAAARKTLDQLHRDHRFDDAGAAAAGEIEHRSQTFARPPAFSERAWRQAMSKMAEREQRALYKGNRAGSTALERKDQDKDRDR